MPLDGKRVNELSRVSKTTEDALLVVDNGGKELNSIFVRDLVVSSSSGNGFDFIGTEEEFNTALLSGQITDETVSLVTDDVYSIDEELGGIKESLNNKADLNLGNTNPSSSFKEMSIGWGIPDYSTFTTIASSTNFKAPSAGVISFVPTTNTDTSVTVNVAGSGYLSIAGKTLLQTTYAHGSDSGHPDGGLFPIDKGETVFHTMTYGTVYFYPLKGA